MPTTLTLKNIPDEIYNRLKYAATINHRSLNSEVLVCLESVLLPQLISPQQRVERANALLVNHTTTFYADDIEKFKQEGRA